MTKLTAEWVRKADRDVLAANDLSQSPYRLHDQMAFHARDSRRNRTRRDDATDQLVDFVPFVSFCS